MTLQHAIEQREYHFERYMKVWVSEIANLTATIEKELA